MLLQQWSVSRENQRMDVWENRTQMDANWC